MSLEARGDDRSQRGYDSAQSSRPVLPVRGRCGLCPRVTAALLLGGARKGTVKIQWRAGCAFSPSGQRNPQANCLRSDHVRAMKRWNDLGPRTRRLLVVAGAIDAVLKIAALIDLTRRPSDEVRGSKAGWAAAVSLVNSLGVVPLAYFAWGRRKSAT